YARSEEARARWTIAASALVMAELQKNEAAITKLRGVHGRITPFEIFSTEPKPSESCQTCGKALDATRSDALYCSAKCKQKAWRKAKRNKLNVTENVFDTASRNVEASDEVSKAD